MKDRRYIRLIHRFQYKLLLRLLTYGVIYQISIWILMFFWRLAENRSSEVANQYGHFFHDYYPMLLCSLFLLPFFAWDVVQFTHRVAGPIFRVRQVLRAIAEGQPVHRIELRAGDQLEDLRSDFDAMLVALQQQGVIRLVDPCGASDDRSGDTNGVGSGEQSRRGSEAGSHVHPVPPKTA